MREDSRMTKKTSQNTRQSIYKSRVLFSNCPVLPHKLHVQPSITSTYASSSSSSSGLFRFSPRLTSASAATATRNIHRLLLQRSAFSITTIHGKLPVQSLEPLNHFTFSRRVILLYKTTHTGSPK